MNTFCQEVVWRGISDSSESEAVGGHICSIRPLFPDDERDLERFNAGPETEELYQDLTYALREVERFLSNLIAKDIPGSGCLCKK